jgi:hypothetical protein
MYPFLSEEEHESEMIKWRFYSQVQMDF